jgi:hypothetical protein
MGRKTKCRHHRKVWYVAGSLEANARAIPCYGFVYFLIRFFFVL